MDTSSILKDEYVALRAEICQSITQQHHILLSGYAAAGAAIGVVFGSSNVGPKALFVVPMILLAMASLWAVECNRMVRASYYIAYVLWPALCKAHGMPSTSGWESWIRIQDGNEGAFRRRQDKYQRIVVLYLPSGLGVAAISIAIGDALATPMWLYPILGFGALSFIIWVYLLASIRHISDLGAVKATSLNQ